MQFPHWCSSLIAIVAVMAFAGCNKPKAEQHSVQEQAKNENDTQIETPSSRGKAQAKQDIANSTLEYKVYGTPATWAHHFYDALEKDYQVKVDHVAGCIVTKEITSYADAYNEIMEREIKRVHGDDIFDRVEAIAIQKQKLEESNDNATLWSGR